MDTFTGPGYGIARIRAEDSDNNYSYVIWCSETSECVVIDPNGPIEILNFIRDNGLSVKYVINTHCHPDHIEGNDPILKVSLSKILVHTLGREKVTPRSAPIEDGDTIKFGNLEIKVVHTPGHCPEHVTLIFEDYVFSGDTLFLSGCGNLKHRGNAEDLFKSLDTVYRKFPEEYKVFVGHDYSDANLRFAFDIEPGNKDAKKKLDEINKNHEKGKEPAPTTIGEEKKYNPFLRFDEPSLVSELKKRNPELDGSPMSVFKELRKLRDDWE